MSLLTRTLEEPLIACYELVRILILKVKQGPKAQGSVSQHHLQWGDTLGTQVSEELSETAWGHGHHSGGMADVEGQRDRFRGCPGDTVEDMGTQSGHCRRCRWEVSLWTRWGHGVTTGL